MPRNTRTLTITTRSQDRETNGIKVGTTRARASPNNTCDTNQYDNASELQEEQGDQNRSLNESSRDDDQGTGVNRDGVRQEKSSISDYDNYSKTIPKLRNFSTFSPGINGVTNKSLQQGSITLRTDTELYNALDSAVPQLQSFELYDVWYQQVATIMNKYGLLALIESPLSLEVSPWLDIIVSRVIDEKVDAFLRSTGLLNPYIRCMTTHLKFDFLAGFAEGSKLDINDVVEKYQAVRHVKGYFHYHAVLSLVKEIKDIRSHEVIICAKEQITLTDLSHQICLKLDKPTRHSYESRLDRLVSYSTNGMLANYSSLSDRQLLNTLLDLAYHEAKFAKIDNIRQNASKIHKINQKKRYFAGKNNNNRFRCYKKSQIKCFNCKKAGHFDKDCWFKPGNSPPNKFNNKNLKPKYRE